MACMLDLLGVLTIDGVIHYDRIQADLEAIPPGVIRDAWEYALDECDYVEFTEWCATAYALVKCNLLNNPYYFFF